MTTFSTESTTESDLTQLLFKLRNDLATKGSISEDDFDLMQELETGLEETNPEFVQKIQSDFKSIQHLKTIKKLFHNALLNPLSLFLQQMLSVYEVERDSAFKENFGQLLDTFIEWSDFYADEQGNITYPNLIRLKRKILDLCSFSKLRNQEDMVEITMPPPEETTVQIAWSSEDELSLFEKLKHRGTDLSSLWGHFNLKGFFDRQIFSYNDSELFQHYYNLALHTIPTDDPNVPLKPDLFIEQNKPQRSTSVYTKNVDETDQQLFSDYHIWHQYLEFLSESLRSIEEEVKQSGLKKAHQDFIRLFNKITHMISVLDQYPDPDHFLLGTQRLTNESSLQKLVNLLNENLETEERIELNSEESDTILSAFLQSETGKQLKQQAKKFGKNTINDDLCYLIYERLLENHLKDVHDTNTRETVKAILAMFLETGGTNFKDFICNEYDFFYCHIVPRDDYNFRMIMLADTSNNFITIEPFKDGSTIVHAHSIFVYRVSLNGKQPKESLIFSKTRSIKIKPDLTCEILPSDTSLEFFGAEESDVGVIVLNGNKLKNMKKKVKKLNTNETAHVQQVTLFLEDAVFRYQLARQKNRPNLAEHIKESVLLLYNYCSHMIFEAQIKALKQKPYYKEIQKRVYHVQKLIKHIRYAKKKQRELLNIAFHSLYALSSYCDWRNEPENKVLKEEDCKPQLRTQFQMEFASEDRKKDLKKASTHFGFLKFINWVQKKLSKSKKYKKDEEEDASTLKVSFFEDESNNKQLTKSEKLFRKITI